MKSKALKFKKYGVDFDLKLDSTDYTVVSVRPKTTQEISNRISEISSQMTYEIHTNHELILTLQKVGENDGSQKVISVTSPKNVEFEAIVGNIIGVISVSSCSNGDVPLSGHDNYNTALIAHNPAYNDRRQDLMVVNRTNGLFGFVTQAILEAFEKENQKNQTIIKFPTGFSVRNMDVVNWIYTIFFFFLMGAGVLFLIVFMLFGTRKYDVICSGLFESCLDAIKNKEL